MVEKERIIRFIEQNSKRVMILDGAMGTEIQHYSLDENDYRGHLFAGVSTLQKGNHDVLSLTRPDVIEAIHASFLEAGADYIETNTFNANAVSQLDYGLVDDVRNMNLAATALAKKVAAHYSYLTPDKPRGVLGSVGPTNRTLSISSDSERPGYTHIDFDAMKLAYAEQMDALIEGGVDALLIETIFDSLNARAALCAAQEVFEKRCVALPIMLSVTIADKSGRTLSGQTLEAFVASMSCEYVVSFGINCSFGAKDMVPYLETLSKLTPLMLSAYPNAGLPNALGLYDEMPQKTVLDIKPLLEYGLVNFLGGCCGTRPEHIRAIADAAKGCKPRQLTGNQDSASTIVAGLEAIGITKALNFVNIGERTNVAGSAVFAKLIREKNYDRAIEIAAQQVANGAQIIDVNVDDGLLDSEHEMGIFLKRIAQEPDICKVPIMIDSSKWRVQEAGLKAIQGKHIVNSISLKAGEEAFVTHARAIKAYGAALVVMAFDEEGQAETYERKIDIARRAYRILVEEVHFPPQDIIFDVNILAIGTGIEAHANYATDFIKAVAWIKTNLPHVKTSGGVSNLSFAFRGNPHIREAMHAVFLYHAIKAGLDMAILNPASVQIYDTIDPVLIEHLEALIFNRSPNATEALLTFIEHMEDTLKKDPQSQEAWRQEPVDKRLEWAILKGVTTDLHRDLKEALDKGSRALDLIEGPLMAGMTKVGEQFGEGKMFLPQVVKSARVMKAAVAYLGPTLEGETHTERAGKVLLATVKGDVHDIGKHIVSIVLTCNAFEVVDLGIMVEPQDIIKKAIEEKVDIIGVSGLITPSLDEMVTLARTLEKEGLRIPLMVGGATTSVKHTALKIAPVYSGLVLHSTDAPHAVYVAKQLLNPQTREAFIEQKYSEYALYTQQKAPLKLSIEEAKNRAKPYDFSHLQAYKPKLQGKKIVADYAVKDLVPYIQWDYFFHAWEFKGKYPSLLEKDERGEAAKALLDDALCMLEKMSQTVSPKAIVGIYPARRLGDGITIALENEAVTLDLPRQQRLGSEYLSLADFMSPEPGDYIGMFAVTAGRNVDKMAKAYEEAGDMYHALLVKTLGDRIAEALSEACHQYVRRELWGYDRPESQKPCSGIRPAFGYSCLPSHADKAKLFQWLNVEKDLEVELTETYMMKPASSVCGLYIAHPQSKYFHIV